MEAPVTPPATRPEKRGHLLSDPARKTQTLTFQSKLASNINTYIKSQYCPTSLTATNSTWNDYASAESAILKI